MKGENELQANSWGKSISGRGKGMYKGPTTERDLAYAGNRGRPEYWLNDVTWRQRDKQESGLSSLCQWKVIERSNNVGEGDPIWFIFLKITLLVTFPKAKCFFLFCFWQSLYPHFTRISHSFCFQKRSSKIKIWCSRL